MIVMWQEMKKALVEDLKKCNDSFAVKTVMGVSTFLDPRFKSLNLEEKEHIFFTVTEECISLVDSPDTIAMRLMHVVHQIKNQKDFLQF